MKKIIQTGLIVSGIASSLVASQTTDPIKHGAVNVSKDGSIELKFTSPYANPIIDIESLGDKIEGKFSISLVDAEQDQYKITLQHKGKVLSCNYKKFLNEPLRLHIIPNEVNTTQFAEETIMYKPCYKDENNKYHFETEHPYKNNTNITKTLPPLCPEGKACTKEVKYATIKGETEKDYDFITISQGGKELGKFSGKFGTTIAINSYLPTKIHFKSDHVITKSGVTVDLGSETQSDIRSIESAKNRERRIIVHHVVMKEKLNTSKSYSFELISGPGNGISTSNAKPGVDYETTPTFSTNKVKYKNGKVIVEAGVTEFDIKIQTLGTNEPTSIYNRIYTIKLESVQAEGKIIQVDL